MTGPALALLLVRAIAFTWMFDRVRGLPAPARPASDERGRPPR